MKSANAPNGATMLATKERVGLVDAAYGSAMIVHGSEINDFIPSARVTGSIEFGGVNRNQAAQPFLQAAANDCADDVATAMQEAYNDMTGGDK